MSIYYNENDPRAVDALYARMAAGEIPLGVVDSRSIVEVEAADLRGFTQCHFFAGIGVWAEALWLAEVSETVPLWTGSCPCQPFSPAASAHGRKGFDDARDLWPTWRGLIDAERPELVLGEQVATGGGAWLDRVFDEMGALGYAVGAAGLGAAGEGAPHFRLRTYFGAVDQGAAHASGIGRQGLVARGGSGAAGPGWPCGAQDMLDIFNAPFERGNRHPQPLLRRVDDGYRHAEPLLKLIGNAIVPQTAARFIRAFLGALGDVKEHPFL